MIPNMEDDLPRKSGEPDGYHLRRTTETGYPLMGSSPAERDELQARMERHRIESMRNHPFEGDGVYCQKMLDVGSTGSDRTGFVCMQILCGYQRYDHPS